MTSCPFPWEPRSLSNPCWKTAEGSVEVCPCLLSPLAWWGGNPTRGRGGVLGRTSHAPFSTAAGLTCWEFTVLVGDIVLFHLGICMDILGSSSNDHILSKKPHPNKQNKMTTKNSNQNLKKTPTENLTSRASFI